MFVKRLFDRHVAMRCLCVKNVGDAVRGVLTDSNLPLRLFDPIMEACGREPTPTAFGVSQAITLAAQRFSPEEGLQLEQAIIDGYLLTGDGNGGALKAGPHQDRVGRRVLRTRAECDPMDMEKDLGCRLQMRFE